MLPSVRAGMTVGERLRSHPENAAAIANALVVLLGPVVLLLLGSLVADSSDTSVTVRAPGAGSAVTDLIGLLVVVLPTMAGPATIAGWRTLVLAKQWQTDGTGSWRGVLEAGAAAFGIALLVLSPGILTRPREAPPYVIAYGGAAMILGLLVGLILRATALIVLRSIDPLPSEAGARESG